MQRTDNDTTAIPAFLCPRNPNSRNGLPGRFYSLLQACYLLALSFMAHQGPLRASALTYTTVLSLVPFLAIAFSVLKGLGAHNTIEPMLRSVAGDSGDLASRIIEYVNNTNVKSLGAIGLLVLILAVISLLENIEKAFNTIWGVNESRTLQRRFSDYLSVVVVGPVLLLAAMSMTSALQSQWVVKWLIEHTIFGDAFLMLFRLLPYVSIWVAMVFLYVYMPNTRVKLRSAVLGGVLSGTLWQIAQWGYFHFQVGLANYNAIYGTMAALPIFLVWIYASWFIVLFGLEIVHAHQCCGNGLAGLLAPHANPTRQEALALALMIQVCRSFRRGGAPPAAETLAKNLDVSFPRLEDTIRNLAALGYLVPTSGREPGWLPARAPNEMTVLSLLADLRGISAVDNQVSSPVMLEAVKVLARGWDGTSNSLEGLTLHDLASPETSPAD